MLVQTGPDRFAFRHALTREVVADRVPDAAHRRWHARAYAARYATGAPDAVLARHAAGAGMAKETIHSALCAAEALLAAGSGAEALRMAELALETGAHPTGPVHALAARAAYAAGWFDEAEAHTRAWREQSDGAAAVDAHCLLASLRWSAGDLAGQRRELQAAQAAQAAHDIADESPLLARVHTALARSLLRAEQDAEARPLNAVRRASMITRLGRNLMRTGRLAEARELADEACALLAAWPGPRLAAAQALRQAAGGEPALTARERQVRDMVAEGLSNKQIATRLDISPHTVAVHVSRLLTKTGATSRTHLAVRHLSLNPFLHQQHTTSRAGRHHSATAAVGALPRPLGGEPGVDCVG